MRPSYMTTPGSLTLLIMTSIFEHNCCSFFISKLIPVPNMRMPMAIWPRQAASYMTSPGSLSPLFMTSIWAQLLLIFIKTGTGTKYMYMTSPGNRYQINVYDLARQPLPSHYDLHLSTIVVHFFNQNYVFFYVLYSTLLNLPPLRLHRVWGCWDRKLVPVPNMTMPTDIRLWPRQAASPFSSWPPYEHNCCSFFYQNCNR